MPFLILSNGSRERGQLPASRCQALGVYGRLDWWAGMRPCWPAQPVPVHRSLHRNVDEVTRRLGGGHRPTNPLRRAIVTDCARSLCECEECELEKKVLNQQPQ